MKLPNFDLRLYGKLIFTNAMGESGGASKIGCSWPWSEHCFWVGLMTWPGFGAASAALGSGFGTWFAVELQAEEVLEAMTLLGLMEDELLGGANWWVGVSAIGLAQVVVPLRLKEPDFTGKTKPPLSWEVVLMGRNTQPFFVLILIWGANIPNSHLLLQFGATMQTEGSFHPPKLQFNHVIDL